VIWDIIVSFFCGLLGTCAEDNCRVISFAGSDHIVCSYDVADIDVRLFLNNKDGKPYRSLRNVGNSLTTSPKLLMNGGMYHEDLGAVGLYVSGGREEKSVSTKDGWGNFHLLPNGVFFGENGKLGVFETKAYLKRKIKADFATQSGPMLVINGKLHPRFLKNSDSRKIRNGVGVSKDGKRIHFAISKRAVTFWDFGELFQKELKTHNALFLDGTVSAIKTKNMAQGGWRDLGPIIGVFGK